MEQGVSEAGISKHRKSGSAQAIHHFTGKKGGKRVRRKKKKRIEKKRIHVSKYRPDK